MVLWELQASRLGGPLLYEQQFVSEASLASLLERKKIMLNMEHRLVLQVGMGGEHWRGRGRGG